MLRLKIVIFRSRFGKKRALALKLSVINKKKTGVACLLGLMISDNPIATHVRPLSKQHNPSKTIAFNAQTGG